MTRQFAAFIGAFGIIVALSTLSFASADIFSEIPEYEAFDLVLYVPDQQPGNQLTAAVVAVRENGFIVAYGVQEDGSRLHLGNSELLTPGRREFVAIPLNFGVRDGDRVYVTVFADTNGNGLFDANVDEQMLDSSSQPVSGLFIVSQNAPSIFPEAQPEVEVVDFIGQDGEVVEPNEEPVVPDEASEPAAEVPAGEPVTEEPVVEEPVQEGPVAETPVSEEPVPAPAEEPAAEVPAAEEPVVEEPPSEPVAEEEPVAEPSPEPEPEPQAEPTPEVTP